MSHALDTVNPAVVARCWAAIDGNVNARTELKTVSVSSDRGEIARFVRAMFKHADAETFVCICSFKGNKARPTEWQRVGDLSILIDTAFREAVACDQAGGNVAFAPPVATFRTKSAKTEALACGVALSVDCDVNPVTACKRLASILSPPTIAVASGGMTADGESKVHLHYRLSVPTRTAADHEMLRRARALACDLIGADGSAKAIVHPLRWPGSVHKKAAPKLARIVAETDREIDLPDALQRLQSAADAAGLFVERTERATTEPTADTEKVSAAVAVIPNNRRDWEHWNRVGMAIYAATGGMDEGADIFETWSAKLPEAFDPHATSERWRHYRTSPPNSIGAGTLFRMANETGLDWRAAEENDGFDILPDEPGTPSAPGRVPGYALKKNGLFRLSDDPDKPATFLCARFDVLGMARDGDSEQWGVLLGWNDPDGKPHTFLLDSGALTRDPSECLSRLAAGGLEVRAATYEKGLLAAYLSAVRVPNRITSVDAVGWHGVRYVTPSRTYGTSEGERVIMRGAIQDAPTRGTLEGWQQECSLLAVGNSRLAFGISAAFAGPLLKLIGEESGGVHFRGDSSIGKTKLLAAAASVWSRPVASWRTTDNAAEGLAVASNDGLLCLDEIGQGEGRAVDALAYMLANGGGKARSRADSSNRPIKKFRLIYLSTGEVGLDSKISEQPGRRAKAGQEVRVLDIPADAGAGHGAFEKLHGSANGAAFAERLARAIGDHAGHAAGAFLEKLVSNRALHIATVEAARRAFIDKHCPAGADGQVSRAAGRFGLIAAAGELAAAHGVLPWPKGEATRAAATCFRAWIAERGGTGAREVMRGIEQVREFIAAHGASRFETLNSPLEQRIINRVGFRRLDDMGRWEFYASPEGFQEITRGHDPKAIASALAGAGLLRRDSQGKNSVAINIPGHGKKRLYHFPATDDVNTSEAESLDETLEEVFDDLDDTEGL